MKHSLISPTKALAVDWLKIRITEGRLWNIWRRKYLRVRKHSVTMPSRSSSVIGGSVGSFGAGTVVHFAEGLATMLA